MAQTGVAWSIRLSVVRPSVRASVNMGTLRKQVRMTSNYVHTHLRSKGRCFIEVTVTYFLRCISYRYIITC